MEFVINICHNSDPKHMKNRTILVWFKDVLTALHVNCMILFDKAHLTGTGKNLHNLVSIWLQNVFHFNDFNCTDLKKNYCNLNSADR